jgi:hypothetical protein
MIEGVSTWRKRQVVVFADCFHERFQRVPSDRER